MRNPVQMLRAPAVAALLASGLAALGQGAQPAPGQEPRPGNPVADAVRDRLAAPAISPQQPPKDYRSETDPSAQREPRGGAGQLPLFGHSFFDPARAVIEQRRAFYRASRGEPGVPPVVRAANGAAPAAAQAAPAPATAAQGPASAYEAPVDPITMLYRNILGTVPANYQLAPGDQILVGVSSPTMELREWTVTVDPRGSIQLPEIGTRLTVAGLTAEQAERALRTRLAAVFRNAEVTLTLRELRTISVTVSGNSFAPGTYEVPAITTVQNLIYATGGPASGGTLRRIEVRRGGALLTTVDYYRFLITGDAARDMRLQPGDVIYFPGPSSRVEVRGEVATPAAYELLPGETLADALRYAGGLKAASVAQRVLVSTFRPGAARMLRDVDATDPRVASGIPMHDGDTVEVFSVRSTLANKVTVEGAVDQPAEYELLPGMTVADLVERARGLLSDAYPARADVFRYNPDNTLARLTIDLEKALKRDPAHNLALARWDRLKVYTRAEIQWSGRRSVTITGPVQRPGIYYRSDNMRVKDLLVDAGGTLPEAHMERAELLHQRPDGTFAFQQINLAEVVKENPAHNLLLEDRDLLAVYRADETRFSPERFVTLVGESVSTGKFPRGEGMRLSHLLQMAGGLRPTAAGRIVVARARVDRTAAPVEVSYPPNAPGPSPDPLLEDGDIITVQASGDIRVTPYVVEVVGAVKRPGPVVLKGPEARITDAIREAGGLQDDAYPLGAEFYRSPALLVTPTQRDMTAEIGQLFDILNESEYGRKVGKAMVERLRSRASSPPGAGLLLNPLNPATGLAADAAQQAAATIGQDASLVSPPRKLTPAQMAPNGSVAVNFPAALAKPGSRDDLVLADGDVIRIPTRPTTVQVVGAVVAPRAVLYDPRHRAQDYVDRTGGFTQDAARDRIVVIRLGGGMLPLQRVRSIEPGDIILVPTRVLAERIHNRSAEVANLFAHLTSSAIVFKILTGLLD